MATNKTEESTYQSYLLRLWRDIENSPWRASLQSTATEEIHQFADVGQMWAFLVARLGSKQDGTKSDELPNHSVDDTESASRET